MRLGNGAYAVDESDSCFQAMTRHEGWKGRAYKREVYGAGGALLQRSLHSFARVDLPYWGDASTAGASNHYKRVGVWRAFNFENQTETQIYAPPGTTPVPPPAIKISKSFYNLACAADTAQTILASYGNVGCTQEYDGTTLLRTNKRWFVARNDSGGYLVDRQFQAATYNASGHLLALSNQFYDGTTNADAAPTLGQLKRETAYYDIPSNLSSTTGVTLHGRDTAYAYDAYGNRAGTTSYSGASTRLYNGTTTTWGALNGTARATTTAYDPTFHALPTSVTNPLSHIERADYDYRMGTLIQVVGPNGPATPTNCRPASFSIPAGEESTCAQYDVFGRMVALIKPGDTTAAPTVQAIHHDVDAQLILPLRYQLRRRDTSADGVRIEQQFYDGMGRLIQTKAESLDGTQNIVVDSVFDGLGQTTRQSQPRYVDQTGSAFSAYTPVADDATERWTTTTYDMLGRPLVVTAPDQTITTEHHYGVVNNLTFHDVIDPNRHRSQSRSDVFGRLVEVLEISGNCGDYWGPAYSCPGGADDPNKWAIYARTYYSYSPLDLLTSVVDAHNNTTTIQYDTLGRKTSMTDPDMGAWTYEYDANGNLKRQLDARGQQICFYYDDLDRLIAKHYPSSGGCPAGAPALSGDTSYSYDQGIGGKGQRTAMSVIGGAATSWEYTARGQTKKATYTLPGLSGTRIFQWTYDSAERLATLTYPSDEVVTYGYDAAWRPASACSSLGGCYVTNSQPYSALGQPVQWTFGNSAVQSFTYDSPMARLQKIYVGSSAGSYNLMHRTYGYDKGGNVERIGDANLAETQNFSYDHRDRLVHAWTSSGVQPPLLLGAPLAPAGSEQAGTTTPPVVTADEAQALESRTAVTTPDAAMPSAIGASTGTAPPLASSAPAPMAAASAAPASLPDFARLPLSFVPNRGQHDATVRYTVREAGGTLFFTPDEAVLALPDLAPPITTTVVRLRYVGANPNPSIAAGARLPGVVNELLGEDPAQWRTNIPTYAGLTYTALYNGIDLQYEGTDGHLKSTFVVAPGADPAQIQWRYHGATDVQVDPASGNLVVTLPSRGGPSGRTLTEHAPIAWQEIGGQRVPVNASFAVDQSKQVRFVLGSYNPARPLLIDPILTYASVLGGTASDEANAIAVDSSGSPYIAGGSYSSAFPTQNPYQATRAGSQDAIVSKFSADGLSLLYSTYIGSSQEDEAKAIALDASGNIYLAGATRSSGFPDPGGLDTSFGGGTCGSDPCHDGFMLKLNAAGTSILYGTFLGGGGEDKAEALAVDSSGNAYVTGYAASGITTKNAPTGYSSYQGGTSDGFLVKINPATTGSASRLYAAYLGSSGVDQAHAVAIDSSNNAYVTGQSSAAGSTAFRTTSGAYQSANAGSDDVFVTKFNPAASGTASVLYGSLLGGGGSDVGWGIAVDSAGIAYITGRTGSTALPTVNAWQASSGGGTDAFLASLNPALSGAASLLSSSYLGGSDGEEGLAIAVESATNLAYLTGWTRSDNFPTHYPLQASRGAGTCGAAPNTYPCKDAFVIAFSLSGNTPEYSSYLGGSDDDEGHAIALGSSGTAYVTGSAKSATFAPSQTRLGTGGGSDAFVAKITIPTLQFVSASTSASESAANATLTVNLSAASAYTVTVNYASSNGSALAGSDYTASSGILTFAPGQTSKTINVSIANDPNDEPNETFAVNLSGAANARLGTPSSATVTISDDDAPPTITWQPASVSVGEATGNALLTVGLSAASAFTVTVNYDSADGSASAPADYTSTSGTLTFAPGLTSLLVSVPIANDSEDENLNESFSVTLSNPTNASIPNGSQSATITIVDDDTPPVPPPSGYDEFYTYNALGNLMSKAGVLYSYPASGSPRPHAVSSAGSQTFAYDQNGNMTSAGGLLTSWDAENRPTSIARVSGTESYSYDADGERITRVSGSTTTFYLASLWEETNNGATKSYYSFNGQVVALRDSSSVTYLHTDHLGSISVASGANASLVSKQDFDLWGKRRGTNTISQTNRNYTGQYLDDTGLLYYHARYYDPNIGRFVSADSIVAGIAAGSGGAAASLGYDDQLALTPLAVDFHEPGFVATLNAETAFTQAKGFWFQLNDKDRRNAKLPWGPANPQVLNRYSYVLNNPLRYTDPTGHCIFGVDTAVCLAAAGAVAVYALATIAVDSATRYAREHPINWGNYYRADTSDEEEYDEEASSVDRTLQTGGNTVKNSTANALNEAHGLDLHRREWGRALEALKKDLGLGNNHHGKIMESGDYVDADTGEYLGNLLDFLP